MELHLVLDGGKDLAGQVYRQLRDAIRSGRLADGQQLPPTRLLAEQLGVSRKTVSQAYARLTLEALLVGHTGRGSFVSAPAQAAVRPVSSQALSSHATLDKWNAMATPLRHAGPESHARYDFIGGTPAQAHFPHRQWRSCLLHGLRQEEHSRGRYAQAEGLPELRSAIARHIGFARGVACSPAQVVVTNGAQQALDLLGRVLLGPGDTVAVEDPGYPLARLLFASQGARVASVPVDAEGIVVGQIPANAKLIYVTPAHQLPLGMPMSVARRHALLEQARRIGAIIIEDDYDSEFRYEGQPTDSLQSMDRHSLVAFVGSFSKVMLPALRVGYVVVPQAILNALLAAKHLSDWHTATLIQYALAKFIDDGHLNKHIRRGASIYASRRAELQRIFAGPLAPWFRLVPASAGLHLAAQCVAPVDIDLLIRLARRADVGLYSLADFHTDAVATPGLFLGYGAIDTLDIAPALERMLALLQQM
ncbi:MAG: PLP-dependent aminotransferase family protein [Pseudomonadota bacterium]